MRIVKNREEIREIVKKAQMADQSIGFVPTMGYLHQGHLSLMKKARAENDLLVISIFVNPTQFGPNEDFSSYPRDLSRDEQLAATAGVDYIFAPEKKEMYPISFQTSVQVTHLSKNLCGEKRPGHFAGVCTIVTKLFNLIQPDRAYFGQKDAQQAIIIQQLVKDLDLSTEVVVCPIVREADGLAMSSRNKHLNPAERKEALILYKSLIMVKEMVKNGQINADFLKTKMMAMITDVKGAKIDYVAIVALETLQPVEKLRGQILIALAVFIGKTRLIDNIILEVT